jgi:hypothetical protein
MEKSRRKLYAKMMLPIRGHLMNFIISPTRGFTDWSRPALISTIAATACLAMAACGLQKGTNAACSNGRVHRAPAGSKTVAGNASKICAHAAIRARLDSHAARSAARTVILPLDFTNVSATTCRLAGFPAVALVASHDGPQVGSAGIADRRLGAQTLDLPAGRTAHIWLRFLDVMNLPVARCRPVTAAGLRVVLPGQADPTYISHALTTCANRVNGTDILMVEPLRPGHALQETTQ